MTMLERQPQIRLFHVPGAYRLRTLAFFVFAFGITYGTAMGLYSVAHGRALQIVFSAVKVPLLLIGTFGLSLPSFFVLNTLLGVREDFGDALRAHVQAQASLTLVLCSLAPFTLTWYASSDVYPHAILINAAMFGLASLAAQLVLRRLYKPLIARNVRHRTLLRAWLVLYAFVGIQLGWVLRPFIGMPGSAVTFFRQGAWGNAYIEIWRMIRESF
jgi:hypothetical protein